MERRNLSYEDGMMIWKTEDDYRWLKRMRRLVATIKILTYVIQGFLALMTLSALHDGFWQAAGWTVLASAMVAFVRWAKVRYYRAERERLRDAASVGAAPYHHDKEGDAMRQIRMLLVLLLLAGLSGCAASTNEWLGRQLSGLDCRPEKLDAAGRCVAAR